MQWYPTTALYRPLHPPSRCVNNEHVLNRQSGKCGIVFCHLNILGRNSAHPFFQPAARKSIDVVAKHFNKTTTKTIYRNYEVI